MILQLIFILKRSLFCQLTAHALHLRRSIIGDKMPKIYRLIVITISMMVTPLYAADIPEFLASADSEIEVVLLIVDNAPGDVSIASISNLKISRTEKHQMLVKRQQSHKLSKALYFSLVLHFLLH